MMFLCKCFYFVENVRLLLGRAKAVQKGIFGLKLSVAPVRHFSRRAGKGHQVVGGHQVDLVNFIVLRQRADKIAKK